jgi:hypothetical protein
MCRSAQKHGQVNSGTCAGQLRNICRSAQKHLQVSSGVFAGQLRDMLMHCTPSEQIVQVSSCAIHIVDIYRSAQRQVANQLKDKCRNNVEAGSRTYADQLRDRYRI